MAAPENAEWYSIEDKRRDFSVYRWDTYPAGSVLAGQHRKTFVTSFPTEAEARAAFPTAQEGTQKRDPGNTFAHLPGENDPVPGGMYLDDY